MNFIQQKAKPCASPDFGGLGYRFATQACPGWCVLMQSSVFRRLRAGPAFLFCGRVRGGLLLFFLHAGSRLDRAGSGARGQGASRPERHHLFSRFDQLPAGFIFLPGGVHSSPEPTSLFFLILPRYSFTLLGLLCVVRFPGGRFQGYFYSEAHGSTALSGEASTFFRI